MPEARLFEHLAPDNSLQIAADHDPKPLRLHWKRVTARAATGDVSRKDLTSGAFAAPPESEGGVHA